MLFKIRAEIHGKMNVFIGFSGKRLSLLIQA